MIKAIIFDLDSCLAAANEAGDHLYAPAFAAIRAANDGSVSESTLSAAFDECWRCAFDAVAAKHGFTGAMFTAGWNAFASLEITGSMRGYDDLALVKELPVTRFLVTSGFRRLQESKVRALGFADWFAAIHIDAIDEPCRKGKLGIFEGISAACRVRPEEVLVVGDNPESEIEAGNRLGMRTIQILRPGVVWSDRTAAHIRGLDELRRYC